MPKWYSELGNDAGTGGSEAARFTTAGNLAFPSGQGIDFSATANSSGTMTSELLNDYEVGSFYSNHFLAQVWQEGQRMMFFKGVIM
jgi:hypothetical protein